MKDKELKTKIKDYLLGKEDLFGEVVDKLTEKIKDELTKIEENIEGEDKNV